MMGQGQPQQPNGGADDGGGLPSWLRQLAGGQGGQGFPGMGLISLLGGGGMPMGGVLPMLLQSFMRRPEQQPIQQDQGQPPVQPPGQMPGQMQPGQQPLGAPMDPRRRQAMAMLLNGGQSPQAY